MRLTFDEKLAVNYTSASQNVLKISNLNQSKTSLVRKSELKSQS